MVDIADGATGEPVPPNVIRGSVRGTGTVPILNLKGVVKTAVSWDLIRKPKNATQRHPRAASVSIRIWLCSPCLPKMICCIS